MEKNMINKENERLQIFGCGLPPRTYGGHVPTNWVPAEHGITIEPPGYFFNKKLPLVQGGCDADETTICVEKKIRKEVVI